ncbi:MAG: YHS domain-containing protein [Proteobacteria bacterium]|nr:MAG: YHS domain-containing protein [Pseudomonadota bacterium]QKK11235.1 MAG: YHS domain-containing protein [Pseudomonadota bacterium]
MSMLTRAVFGISGLLLVLLSGGTAAAAEEPVFSTRAGAIRGYDPVAYFAQGKPVKGDPRFSLEYQGATWRFASAENRDRFAAEPGRYAPQYGGYCAWAVSQGYTASVVPDAWRIVNNKLYLNYSTGVQRRWSQDVPGNIAKADANWPAVLSK